MCSVGDLIKTRLPHGVFLRRHKGSTYVKGDDWGEWYTTHTMTCGIVLDANGCDAPKPRGDAEVKVLSEWGEQGWVYMRNLDLRQ